MAAFTVTNLNDSGVGSLRAAIEASNAGPAGGENTISFAAGLTGTITLDSDLPSVTRPTSIVAGSTTIGTAPTVGIDFNGHAGLTFAVGSDGSTLVGLSVGNATGNGITLDASDITLNNNYIGVALDGGALGNSGDGVFVSATSSGNTIGSNPDATVAVANVISGNGGNGISLHGSDGNTIVSNRIGTSIDGIAAMTNGANGIWVTDQSNGNTIGGDATGVNAEGEPNDPTNNKGQDGPNGTQVIATPPLGNLVSGNGENGILIDQGSETNVLNGNFVGTDVTGNAALGNAGDGIAIDGADNNSLIGCLQDQIPFAYYNVVGGNGGNGLRVTDSDGTIVWANFFGIGANNMDIVGNTLDGILINGSSADTTVGGEIPLGNVASGNGQNGIEVADTASGFKTLNTFAGALAFYGPAANGNDGLLITSTGGGQIIRTNVFSGNANNGIEIAGDASGVTIAPNIVGLYTRGDEAMPNGNNGVLITGTAHDITVGATGPDQVSVMRQNTFSGNVNYGLVISGQAHDNSVFGSAIGTDIQETLAIGNGAGGILLSSTGSGNMIGIAELSSIPTTPRTSQFNVISGNTGNGITIADGANGDRVVNNWIGLDTDGNPTLPNTGQPIAGTGTDNLIYGNDGITIVHSGHALSDFTVVGPTTLEVYDGGQVKRTTVQDGGIEVVSVGGRSDTTTVESGGTLIVLGDAPGGAVLSGVTTIAAGATLQAFGLGLAGGAKLVQQGTATADAVTVDGGAIEASGGSFDAESLDVGSKGAVSQSGGTIAIEQALSIATGGTYTLADGVLSADTLGIETGGIVRQNGGDASFAQDIIDDGRLVLSDGTLGAAALVVGEEAKAKVTQSGGVVTIDGAITIAAGGTTAAGSTYTLEGGQLVADALAVLAGGFFYHDSGLLTLAGTISDDGTIGFNGGLRTVGALDIGETARGRFVQSGGSTTISGAVTIAGGGSEADGSSLAVRDGTFMADSLTIDEGGTFKQTGGGTTIAGNLTNDDSLTLTGGLFSVDGSVDGTGTIALGQGILSFQGAVSSGQSIRFAKNVDSPLELGDADSFEGTVAGFSANDSIDLQDFAFASTSISGVTGTGAANTYTNVTLTDGVQAATFALFNKYTNQFAVDAGAYTLSSDLAGAAPGTLFQLAP
ncbi:hypothetical protein BH10PSE6_BH10PSE6_07130 [soil metagenome]